ncbi:exosome complex component RRP46-like [Eriocheir sinensis]|uniref:exosome complex component RRP46-like n=1 Tax=Eriocheir sinensis TaxID=95602 RepID=UPI0021C6DEBF|nr:exosome complex component RRP46-like [Eriocheir sinensis]XP_050698859.1 exosome complex component RRP46-like [Eriocheir sinensis]
MAKHACELSFLSRSDGSALYSIGLTVALASVNGPGDVKVSNRLYNRAHLEVCYSPTTGHSMIRERALESLIMHTVEQAILVHLHPRTAINVTIQEMQSDGSALSTSINAACMALLDAGIQMKATFAAVTCCITPYGTILIDPTEAEIQESVAEATFVFDGSGEGSVLTAHQDGQLSYEDFKRCLKQCQEASKDVFAFYRRVIENKYQNEPES